MISVQLNIQNFMAEPIQFETWQDAKSYLIKDCWALQPGSVWVDGHELTLEFDEYYEVYMPGMAQVAALGAYYV